MEYSKLRFWSYGIAAAHKPLNSDMLEVYCPEQTPMAGGELSDNTTTATIPSVNSLGQEIESQLTSTVSISALWLPLGGGNRISSPDVRRNARVMVWKYADADMYFWTAMDQKEIRLLETIRMWMSGVPTEGESEKTDENGYTFFASSHVKKIIAKTSKKNGEVVVYCIQLDMDQGTLTIQDDLGQEISIDSLGGKIFMTAQELIELKTKLINFECEKFVVKASEGVEFITPKVKMSDALEVSGHTLLKSTSVMEGRSNFKGGIGGTDPGDLTSPIDFYGFINHYGSWNTSGNIHANGEVTWDG